MKILIIIGFWLIVRVVGITHFTLTAPDIVDNPGILTSVMSFYTIFSPRFITSKLFLTVLHFGASDAVSAV